MLAPHLKFPPDMYPQTLDQAYGPGVVYAPGMPPPAHQAQYGATPTYSYGNGAYPMQPPYMGASYGQNGRAGLPPGAVPPATAGALPPDNGEAYPSQSRMQSWPNGAISGSSAPAFPPAPGLPLATGLTPVKSGPPVPGFGSSGGMGPPPGHMAGRNRGPSSPSMQSGPHFEGGQVMSNGYVASPDHGSVGSPGSPGGNNQEPRYSDGAVELSVRAREFVPKFAPTHSGMSPVTTGGASAPSQQQQGIIGMGLWNAGSGGADEHSSEAEESNPPLIFPSDLGSSGMGGGMGFGNLRSWGLSDSMDLQMPLESSGLGLSSSLGGSMTSSFGKKFDDADLDMDAALLGSDILGGLDDTELSGVGRSQRQSSFLSSLGSLRGDSDLGSSSSGFSSMFGNTGHSDQSGNR